MTFERPRERPARTGLDLALDSLALALAVAAPAYPLLRWPELPAVVPMHFDAAGQVNGWGPKAGLLFLPAVGLGLFALLGLVTRFPWACNYAVEITEGNWRRQYALALRFLRALRLELVAVFAWIEYASVEAALKAASGELLLGLGFVAAFMAAIFGSIGVYIALSLRNK